MLFILAVLLFVSLMFYYAGLLHDMSTQHDYPRLTTKFGSKQEFKLAWIPYYRWYARICKFYDNLPD